MVRVRGSRHRSPRGAVARVRGVSPALRQPRCSRQRSAEAHARLPKAQRSQAFSGAAEAFGGPVGEEDSPVRPPLGVVTQPWSQAHRGLPYHRLRASRNLQLVCEGGGGQPAQGRRRQGQGPPCRGLQAPGQQRLRQVH